MRSRFQSQHIIRGEREKIASVTINSGGSTPPVRVFAQEGGGSYVDGYLSVEGAELLRRALNDVIGPLQLEREQQAETERLSEILRGLAPRISNGD